MAAIAMEMSRSLSATAGSAEQKLRKVCDEFIGMAMFGQMLRGVRNSSLNSDLFSNNGEKMFQSQLDDVLLREASQGGGNRSPFGGLGDALYNSLAEQAGLGSDLDVKG